MKRKVILMLCLVAMLVLTIICCFFFGLTGKLGLMYVPKYIISDTDNKFVNPHNISKLDILDYNGYAQIKNSLKYCDNITSFAINFDNKIVENIDCLRYFPEVISVGIKGNCKDWSGLSECLKLQTLDITKSNFSDLKYLKNLEHLEYLEIRTDSELIYSDKVDFNSLDWLILDAPVIDISYFDTSVNMTSFTMKTGNIKNTELLNKFVNIKSLMLIGTNIDDDDLKVISKLSSLESLSFDGCNFYINEEDVNNYLKDCFEENAEVKINECIFDK